MIDANQHEFRGLVPHPCLSWITPEESANNWRRTINPGGMGASDCLLVAETESARQVIGFALARVADLDDGPRGEIQVMSVSPAFQRQGVGRRLVQAVAAHLRVVGVRSMLVRVLTVNPNRGFYARLGGRFVREEPYDWEGVPLAMSVYEWADLVSLLAPRADHDQA
jgi:GNAT superfamily N-acetyltransferase